MSDWQMAINIPELQRLFQGAQPNQSQPGHGQRPDLNKPNNAQNQQQNQYAPPQQNYNNNYSNPNDPFANHFVTIDKIESKWRIYAVNYWITVATFVIGGILLLFLANAFRFRDDDIAISVLIWLAILLTTGIVALVNSLGIIYHCWAAIQDGGRARTAPGEAIGFLFIPIYNLYWVFVCYKGLAEDMNNYQMNRNLNYQKVDDGLPSAYCILAICGIIPYLGFLAGLANMVVGFVMIGGFKRSLIHILREKQQLS
jgi:hypothetical protein